MQRRRARLRHMSNFDIETYGLPFGVHLPPYTEEDPTDNNPPTYNQLYPKVEENSSLETENYNQISMPSSGATNCSGSAFTVPDLTENGGLCYENCPYCSSAMQNSASYSYLNYGINSLRAQQTMNGSRSVTDNISAGQNNHSQTVICPAIVHNDGQNVEDRQTCDTNTNEIVQSDVRHIHTPRRFWNRGQCYEVTVNLEWI